MNIRGFILSLSVLLGISVGKAQETLEPNLKFGKPTDQEINMTVYDRDKDAAAVVLYKSTTVRYEIASGSFRTITEVKARVKILKQEGTEYANVEIPYFEMEKASREKEIVSNVKAFSYNNEGGNVVKTKMENSSVFRERVDNNYMLLKFTVPQVKIGTVIEYQYRVESDFYYSIDTWYAQEEIPVVYTNYDLTIPEYFNFSLDQTGTERTENKIDDVSQTLSFEGESFRCNAKHYNMTAVNLPGLKKDPYVYCPKEYLLQVKTELRSVEIPGVLYKNFSTSWEDVSEQLLKDEDFGDLLRRSNPLKEETARCLSKGLSTPREKTAALYTALKERLSWNGKYSLFGESPNKVMKNGTGSNADLNFILISMLKESGLRAYPVVLSRRDLGRIPFTHPSIKGLNTFVVGVLENDSMMFFIDSSVENGYLDVLPPNLLSEQAYVLREGAEGIWVNLQQTALAKKKVIIEGTLKPDGTLEASCSTQSQNQFSASVRKDFKTAKDSISYVKELAEDYGVEIISYTSNGMSQFSDTVDETIHFTKHFETTGDHIYLNPFVIPVMKESPFKEETRALPVEFPYRSSINYVVYINTPEGFTVEELPEKLIISTEDKSVVCRANFQDTGEKLVVTYRLNIEKPFFLVTEYQMLKVIFDEIAKLNNNMIVLKKGQ